MSLPKVHSAHETIDVGGALFDVRMLTRAEAARFQKMVADDVAAERLEIAVVAAATDTPEPEVTEWYGSTPSWAVEELLGHIKRMSRLDEEGAQKS